MINNFQQLKELGLGHQLWLSNPLDLNVVHLRYFKLWILLDQIIYVWNIKDLRHIGFQRYRDFKSIVGGEDSISLWKNFRHLFKKEYYSKECTVFGSWRFF